MHIVMGATGNVGGAVANALLHRGEAVAVIVRTAEGAAQWRKQGATVLHADIDDVSSLRTAFQHGRTAFLLNPPADPAGDTDAEERRTIRNILSALDGSGLEKVVAASTFGARPGEPAGDLTTLWELEEGLRAQSIPAAINRGAYYMTNWVGMIEMVKQSGKLQSMFPSDFLMPMVAPLDLGEAAAQRLLSPATDTETAHIEGPERYTPQDVADALAVALKLDVQVDVAPRAAWEDIYRQMGFSPSAAKAYTRMTAITLDEDFDAMPNVWPGKIALGTFIADLSRGANGGAGQSPG